MRLNFRKAILPQLPYILTGAVLAVFYFVWLMNESPVQGIQVPIILLYLWALFSLASRAFWKYLLAPRLEPYSKRWRIWWLVGCIFIGFWLEENIPVILPGSGVFKMLYLLCSGTGLGLLLFILSVFLVAPTNPGQPEANHRWRWLALALPMIIVWVVVLLAFWPGMMSADSLNQWGQMLTGQYIDHHPAFHTFTIWLLTRIALTPAVVALAQIIALALVTGLLLACIESLGVPSFLIWITSLLFALSPVNATMVNTLWKDIPYSTAMLAVTYLILRMVASKGRWLEGKGGWLVLGITAALAILFRHNGLPVVVGTFVLLLIFFRRQWKPLAGALAVCLGLYYGITGPIYNLVGVERSTDLLDATTSLYKIAANADDGSQADELLATMNPLSTDWECWISTSVDEAYQAEVDQPDALLTKVGNLLEHTPSLLAFDYRCNRSLVWVIWDPNGEVRNPSHAEYWIDANDYGIIPDSKIPWLQTTLTNLVSTTAHDPNINWLVWRPAIYLYLFLGAILIAALRRKNARILLIAVPVLLQSISMTLIPTAPNFRYHYYTYLLALAFWPAIFTKTEPTTPDHPSESTSEPSNHD